MINCQAVKTSIVAYLQHETEILSIRRACIASLPFRILDGVNAEVYIEEITGGYLVHDGGRSIGHLESSGMIVTERQLGLLSQLATRLGASFDRGVFKVIAKESTLQASILAVAQCCCVSMFDLLKHSPSTEEEVIRSRVSADVRTWAARHKASVIENRRVQGNIKQYTLDFYLGTEKRDIGVNILVPTYGAAVSADRFALQSLDVGKRSFKSLAVLVRPEKWKTKSRAVVGKMADEVAEIEDVQGLFENNIAEKLGLLAAA